MAAKKDFVCVMETNIEGFTLCLRSSPSDDSIKWFIREQRRRYYAHESGGPGGNPSVFVKAAKLYRDENDHLNPKKKALRVIDLSDVPSNPNQSVG